jgi:hypothetical protein
MHFLKTKVKSLIKTQVKVSIMYNFSIYRVIVFIIRVAYSSKR